MRIKYQILSLFFAATLGSSAHTGAQEVLPVSEPEKPPIQVSGFVDVYYEWNLNSPPRTLANEDGGRDRVDVQNMYRNFDFRHNEFALPMVKVVVQQDPDPVGFRVDLTAGKSADWIHSSEPGGRDTYKLFQQAFLTVPVKSGRLNGTLDAGKFVTSAGAEVIESRDNWNYTRGLLFALAIPYYHAGVRFTQPLSGGGSVGLQLLNGWNNVEDNNNALSYAVTMSRPLSARSSLTMNYIGGPEQNDNSRDWRHLIDATLAHTVSERLKLMLNADYAWEERDGQSAQWKGVAAYARYALSEKTAAAVRAEWFRDEDGGSTGVSQDLTSLTITWERMPAASLLHRVEARWDHSDENVFLDSDGGTRSSQATLLASAVYSF